MGDRIRWGPVLDRARDIAESYSTRVTVRQLFYRLVAENALPNLIHHYRRLSKLTAEGRRDGSFPDLADRTSRIERYRFHSGPEQAIERAAGEYRRDRTEGQPYTVYLDVEKAGLSAQLDDWFTGPLGIPHVALGGYASQTLCTGVDTDLVNRAGIGHNTVLIYAGDHDPSGVDILRDFDERTTFDKVIKVALTPEQVTEYNLPQSVSPEVAEKLEKDPRAKSFRREFGSLVQYEVDALPPDTLRALYADALSEFFDREAFDAVIEQEQDDLRRLREIEIPE